MFKLPIYGNKTVKLALEFGLIISEVAKENNIKLDKEKIAKLEEIFINEIKTNGFKKTAINFVPLILAAFEV